jgi:hypothetical protein
MGSAASYTPLVCPPSPVQSDKDLGRARPHPNSDFRKFKIPLEDLHVDGRHRGARARAEWHVSQFLLSSCFHAPLAQIQDIPDISTSIELCYSHSLCTVLPEILGSFAQHSLRIFILVQQPQVPYHARLRCIISRMCGFRFSVCCL